MRVLCGPRRPGSDVADAVVATCFVLHPSTRHGREKSAVDPGFTPPPAITSLRLRPAPSSNRTASSSPTRVAFGLERALTLRLRVGVVLRRALLLQAGVAYVLRRAFLLRRRPETRSLAAAGLPLELRGSPSPFRRVERRARPPPIPTQILDIGTRRRLQKATLFQVQIYLNASKVSFDIT